MVEFPTHHENVKEIQLIFFVSPLCVNPLDPWDEQSTSPGESLPHAPLLIGQAVPNFQSHNISLHMYYTSNPKKGNKESGYSHAESMTSSLMWLPQHCRVAGTENARVS